MFKEYYLSVFHLKCLMLFVCLAKWSFCLFLKIIFPYFYFWNLLKKIAFGSQVLEHISFLSFVKNLSLLWFSFNSRFWFWFFFNQNYFISIIIIYNLVWLFDHLNRCEFNLGRELRPKIPFIYTYHWKILLFLTTSWRHGYSKILWKLCAQFVLILTLLYFEFWTTLFTFLQ